MKEKQGPGYIWYKVLLVVGALLGVLLLTQSIRNYHYVSQRLVLEELLREAARQCTSIARHAWQADARDPAQLVQLLDEMREEEQSIAWIRLTSSPGGLRVESGEPVGTPFSSERLGPLADSAGRLHEVRETASGTVLVVARPFRRRFGLQSPGAGRSPRRGSERPPSGAGLPAARAESPQPGSGPPGAENRPRFDAIEVALYWNSAETEFGGLRRNLIVSVSAALALVASMVVLGLRFRNYVRGKQLEQQLELARRVQQELLPPGCPSCGDLDFAAECHPAYQVGGDFYDVFPGDHSRVAMLLGDVSGKGLPAALLMGLLHGAVRTSYWTGNGADHEEASKRLNQLLCMRTSVEMFASLFWCYYDPDAQKLRYVNAGHLPPFVASRNGNGAPELRRLEEGGPVLGVIPAAEYRQGEIRFQSGDLLVLYSDGVVEAVNAAQEEFGDERLASIIRENWSRSSAEIRDEIMRQVRAFADQEQLQDDLTLLVAHAAPPAQPNN